MRINQKQTVAVRDAQARRSGRGGRGGVAGVVGLDMGGCIDDTQVWMHDDQKK
jgi:hypothetical protein